MRDKKEQTLDRLEEEGRLRPSDVVNEARSRHSPLHDCFVWDDTEAAEKYRHVQARQLIRSYKIVVNVRGSVTIMAPRFVHSPKLSPGEEGYVALAKLRSDEDSSRELLMREAAVVRGAHLRMQAIAAALDCAAEIEALGQALMMLQRRFDLRRGDDSSPARN